MFQVLRYLASKTLIISVLNDIAIPEHLCTEQLQRFRNAKVGSLGVR